jgi:ketosteroid isomerase-like protein
MRATASDRIAQTHGRPRHRSCLRAEGGGIVLPEDELGLRTADVLHEQQRVGWISMTTNNSALALELLNAVGHFDADALGKLLAPNVRYWVAGMPRDQFVPRDQMLGMLAQMGSAIFDGPIIYTVHGTTSEGNRVAVEATSKARLRNGKDFANIYHFLFEFEDGRLVLGREYADTQVMAQLAT